MAEASGRARRAALAALSASPFSEALSSPLAAASRAASAAATGEISATAGSGLLSTTGSAFFSSSSSPGRLITRAAVTTLALELLAFPAGSAFTASGSGFSSALCGLAAGASATLSATGSTWTGASAATGFSSAWGAASSLTEGAASVISGASALSASLRRRRTMTLGCEPERSASACFCSAKCSRTRAASSVVKDPAMDLADAPSSRSARSISLLGTAGNSLASSDTLIFSSDMFTPLAPCPGPELGESRHACGIGTEIPAPARSGFFSVNSQNSLGRQHMAGKLGLGEAAATHDTHAHRPFNGHGSFLPFPHAVAPTLAHPREDCRQYGPDRLLPRRHASGPVPQRRIRAFLLPREPGS